LDVDSEETKAGPGSNQRLEQLSQVQVPAHGLELVMPTNEPEEKPMAAHIERPRAAPRKIGHGRLSIEPTAIIDMPPQILSIASDDEISGEALKRALQSPPVLRKQSGEPIRPALRARSAHRRPRSAPGTSTSSKAVHFDTRLEHIRHFHEADKPLEVSADKPDTAVEPPAQASPFEYDIILPNFPVETPVRLAQPVIVERVFLSGDRDDLVGIVAVANLAFQKNVVARFTFDYWKTSSEVIAEYIHHFQRSKHTDGRDRFKFHIKLADLDNLEAKTLFFCVRYTINGQEYWDNNNSTNFQVNFLKQDKAHGWKNGLQGTLTSSLLPRSYAMSEAAFDNSRPRTIPTTSDNFSDDINKKYKLPDVKNSAHTYLGGAIQPPRPNSTSAEADFSDCRATVTGQAFSHLYDFDTSLSAAINSSNRCSRRLRDKGAPQKSSLNADSTVEDASVFTMLSPKSSQPIPSKLVTGPGAGNSILASQPYNELLDKYCFVRSLILND
jgi:hypothetical protein